MKTISFNRSFYYLAYFLLAAVFVISIGLSFSTSLLKYPELATGITFDLTLTAPILYLFIIWKTKIPKTTVVPFFVVSTILASYIIPSEQQTYLNLIKTWMIPIVEIGVLSFLTWSVYKTIKAYKSVNDKDSDILNVLNELIQKLFTVPIVAKFLAFELAVVYYAFFSWRRAKTSAKIFTYHINSGKLFLFGILVFIIAAETVVIHVLLEYWNVYVAWLMTLSSAYVLLQVFAHTKAVYLRPIEVIGDRLFIRYGLFGGAEIKLNNIERVEFTTIKPTEMEEVKQVALIGDIEQFNIKLELKEKATFSGFYGKEEEFKTLLFFIDETEKFKNAIKINDSN